MEVYRMQGSEFPEQDPLQSVCVPVANTLLLHVDVVGGEVHVSEV